MAGDETNRLLLDLYRAARESPVDEFAERALCLFKSVCAFDSGLWGIGKVEERTGLSVDAVHLHNLSVDFLTDYEQVKENDLVAYEAAQRIGEVCSFDLHELMPRSRYADVARFDKRWDLEHLLVATTCDKATGSVGFVSLYRAMERRRYTDDDRRAGEMVLPHLFEAATINRLLWLARGSGEVAAQNGARAIANERGQIEALQPGFADLLRMEWPLWSPPTLPAPLLTQLASPPVPKFLGKRITIIARRDNGLLFLRAQERAFAERLTRAESAVAMLIAEGCSYKEAARRLAISPATVRNQLHKVYAKLSVKNNASLARRLREVRD